MRLKLYKERPAQINLWQFTRESKLQESSNWETAWTQTDSDCSPWIRSSCILVRRTLKTKAWYPGGRHKKGILQFLAPNSVGKVILLFNPTNSHWSNGHSTHLWLTDKSKTKLWAVLTAGSWTFWLQKNFKKMSIFANFTQN